VQSAETTRAKHSIPPSREYDVPIRGKFILLDLFCPEETQQNKTPTASTHETNRAVLNPIKAEHQKKPPSHHRVDCTNYPYTVIPPKPSKTTSFPQSGTFLARIGYTTAGDEDEKLA
jgi:hypothetical protein